MNKLLLEPGSDAPLSIPPLLLLDEVPPLPLEEEEADVLGRSAPLSELGLGPFVSESDDDEDSSTIG